MFWERFYGLCESANTKPNPVGVKLGFSSGLITKWKKGERLPDGDALIAIADYFECSVDYLLGRSDVAHPSSGTSLTESEMELIEYFRQLSRTGQRHVLNSAEEEMRIEAEKGTAATTA